MSKTLFEITRDMQALDDLLAEVGGDITDEQAEQAISEFFAELDADLANKADNYAALIRTIDARTAARKDEAARLYALAKTDEDNSRRLKARLKEALQQRGIDKLETPRYRLSVCNNGGALPVDVQVPAEALPPTYQRVEVSADINAIREALAKGQAIEGCTLMERGTHLRIK